MLRISQFKRWHFTLTSFYQMRMLFWFPKFLSSKIGLYDLTSFSIKTNIFDRFDFMNSNWNSTGKNIKPFLLQKYNSKNTLVSLTSFFIEVWNLTEWTVRKHAFLEARARDHFRSHNKTSKRREICTV